jgi:cell division septum initiation protein DivIVA
VEHCGPFFPGTVTRRGKRKWQKGHVDNRTQAQRELHRLARDAPTMADTLEQQAAKCKKRIAIIEMLIEEQRAAGLSTQEAERVLGLERSFLKILEDTSAAGGGSQTP